MRYRRAQKSPRLLQCSAHARAQALLRLGGLVDWQTGHVDQEGLVTRRMSPGHRTASHIPKRLHRPPTLSYFCM
jgi:hypothetical protein